MIWSIFQAWPVKCEGPGLKATGNDIAIETLELAHEGITVKLP
jgi:phage tail-like protein